MQEPVGPPCRGGQYVDAAQPQDAADLFYDPGKTLRQDMLKYRKHCHHIEVIVIKGELFFSLNIKVCEGDVVAAREGCLANGGRPLAALRYFVEAVSFDKGRVEKEIGRRSAADVEDPPGAKPGRDEVVRHPGALFRQEYLKEAVSAGNRFSSWLMAHS